MPTSIGVFTSRDQAEAAVHELLAADVPQESIALLSPDTAPPEPRHTGKKVGAYLGGAIGTSTGLSLGLAAATLAVPGIGPVVAIGLGAAALLGLGGIRAGKSVGAGIDAVNEEERASDVPDAAFFCNVLAQNRSVIVVQTHHATVHARAAEVLNRLGLKTAPDDAVSTSRVSSRRVSDVLVIALSGRVVVGEASDEFRDLVYAAIESGTSKILVNMADVSYIDSSGIGALVNALIRIRKVGGQLKLTRLSPKISELLELTRLDKVMDIEIDEAKALTAFG